jgi:hypothetical protein
MNPQVLATAKVYWLASEQGGRKAPPSGPIYTATGRFDEPHSELFSVILSFPAPKEQAENSWERNIFTASGEMC